MVEEKAGDSFSPHENNFGCPTIFNMYLFTMLKLLARGSSMTVFAAFLPKTISLPYFSPINLVANEEIKNLNALNVFWKYFSAC